MLDSSTLKELADDTLQFGENGRQQSKNVENTVGKGEIACFKQFLLFPQCLQKSILQTHKKQDLFGKGFNLQQDF